jgi:gliding motility-associated-like protein
VCVKCTQLALTLCSINMLIKQSSFRGLGAFVRSVLVLFSLLIFPITKSLAQCDPNSPYDKIVSGYHQSIALKSTGGFATWGQAMASNGTSDVLTPADINVTNYPNLVGTPLKATIGGAGGGGSEQAILLTSDGLYAWSSEGDVLANALTPSGAFAKVTVGAFDGATTDASTGLPNGVAPADVVSMTASNQTLIILTSSGNVWVLSQMSANLYGNGSASIVANKWQKVKTDGSTDLANITAVRVQVSAAGNNAVIALSSTGIVYTWGSSVYLGDGAGPVAKDFATPMTIPGVFSGANLPKMIGVTGGNKNVVTNNSFYLLANSGALYVLGENGQRQLGTFDQVDALTWTQAERVDGTPFTNINFISVQEHDNSAAGVAAITSTGDLYTWGENEGLMLGRATDGTFYDPALPFGFTSGTDIALSAELGGHTLVYLKEGTTQFCYVGHKTNGSMGDGVSAGSFISTFDCANTPSLSICGSVPVAASTLTSTITASIRSILADGTTTSRLTIQLKTSAGVNLTSSGGNVAVFTSAGTLGSVTNNNDGTYTVILTSVASVATASLTYTLNGSSGTNTESVAFTLTSNTPPTISTVGNQTVVGTTSTGDLAVTVGDAETAVGSLTVTAASSDVNIIPTANIVLGGSGANRTVSVTAASGQTGTVTITLTVTDGGALTATSTFTVTVTAPANNADSDGDGVTDAQEQIDGTDPNSGCDFIKANQVLSAVSTFWKNSDCDNDGISNFLETNGGTNNADFDNDGILNMFDPDSDQDGINDSYEKNIDTDRDGDADYLDLDSDNDGILDRREMVGDMDADGKPNYKDYDSDGDGILDVIEATENFRAGVDRNGDGQVDNPTTDANANGWPDAVDSFAGAMALAVPDTDRDGAPDFLDLDADGDGILDSIELGGDPDKDNIANFRDRDSDGDWLSDGIEGRNDADGDGTPNYLDLDSDGDTIMDSWEGSNKCASCTNLQDDQGDGWDDRKQFPNPLAIDTDGDGTPDFLDLDSDNDCILDRIELGADMDADDKPNFRDMDSDGDGIPDSVEAVVCNAPVDTDADGKPDYLDLDADNDGISDAVEKGADGNNPVDTDKDGTPDYRDLDSDNDGILDSFEGVVDTDGDGTPDYLDLDSDNDGISDATEGIVDTDGDGTPDFRDLDSDNDGIPDAFEGVVDTDKDGTPDYRDLDSDNDGIPDAIEAGKDPKNPVDTDKDGTPDFRDLDSDNDGIPDAIEAGKDAINPVDTDGDGVYDFRDLDSDGDSISDKMEAGADPKKPLDTDGDSTFDFRDLDSDNDTIPDAVELTVDTDGDAKPDYLDVDSDNDGLSDKIEAGANPNLPVDTDKDGKPDFRDLDSDNDGMLDREETGPNGASPLDTDKDGIYDFRDTDADNDGILDVNEDDLGLGNIVDCDKDGIPNRLDADTCPSVAPQGISPNGDGKNDVLAFPGLLATPGPNKLTILNRWGNIVYESADYKNTWGGQTDRAFGLLETDGLLPDGTYYYILDYQGRKPTVKAYIYINRIDK